MRGPATGCLHGKERQGLCPGRRHWLGGRRGFPDEGSRGTKAGGVGHRGVEVIGQELREEQHVAERSAERLLRGESMGQQC